MPRRKQENRPRACCGRKPPFRSSRSPVYLVRRAALAVLFGATRKATAVGSNQNCKEDNEEHGRKNRCCGVSHWTSPLSGHLIIDQSTQKVVPVPSFPRNV